MNNSRTAEIDTALKVTEACGRLLHPESGWRTLLRPWIEREHDRLVTSVLEDDDLSAVDREICRQQAKLLKQVIEWPDKAYASNREILNKKPQPEEAQGGHL